jgi:heterodisulfide reductase subunit A
MMDKTVAVIGGGVAGLKAALELSRLGFQVDVIEKADFAGGHAIQFACKATDQCVKCGACMAEALLAQAVADPGIRLLTGSRIEKISKSLAYEIQLTQKAVYIDARKCTLCGVCLKQCPEDLAITRGVSKSQSPFLVIHAENCRYLADQSCTRCRDECPEQAITLDAEPTRLSLVADAVIWATGFSLFNPRTKPYGYGIFKNVVTNLELEGIVRRTGRATRPSDGRTARSLAFIQCVGSRDAKLNHLWCSKFCCGSALRMANLIRAREPEAAISFFYIDVQTFGRDFEGFYGQVQESVRMIRAIPGDIFQAEDGGLKVTFVDNETHASVEEIFDLVVLAAGMQPCRDNLEISGQLDLKMADSGFTASGEDDNGQFDKGVFTVGTVAGPMSIAESIASAGEAVLKTLKYLSVDR